MYSVPGLEEGIVNAKRNIKSLEEAIDRERNTIKEYRIMIDDIETADRLKKEAEANINVEVAIDGDQE